MMKNLQIQPFSFQNHSDTICFIPNHGGAFLPVIGWRKGSEERPLACTVDWRQGSSLGGPVAVPSWLGTAVPDRKELLFFVKKRPEK